MHRVLVSCLSLYWVVVFAMAAAGLVSVDATAPGPWQVALACGHTLVSALFLWSALVAWAWQGDHTGDVEDVASLALAVAAIALAAATALAGPAAAAQSAATTAIQLAALGATFLVIRGEAGRRSETEPDPSQAVARRLAARAAHGSMLSRLSGRGPNMQGSDV